MENQTHYFYEKENEGRVDLYGLAPGISICFNQIYTDSWVKGDSGLFPAEPLILNFCRRGRCDAALTRNRYAMVRERQVCVSTCVPAKDFYYPGRLYEGVQVYLDRGVLKEADGTDFLSMLGISAEQITEKFCGQDRLYLRRMSDALIDAVEETWKQKEEPDAGRFRYFTARLLYELLEMPGESERTASFTRTQIAIVREAEQMILQDLSRKITAREMAEHFGISESSFKLYVKGILGDSYLSYFRKKRMEKAAELLKTTNLKIIEVASAVGYENQGKFARVFAETYGMPPLEYRRLPEKNKR